MGPRGGTEAAYVVDMEMSGAGGKWNDGNVSDLTNVREVKDAHEWGTSRAA